MKWAVFLLLLPGFVFAQNAQFLACPQVNFFGPACIPASAPIPQISPVEHEEPLFPDGTMAPDTPPLMKALLDDPTPENAAKWFAWHQRRMARIQEVQALLRPYTSRTEPPRE